MNKESKKINLLFKASESIDGFQGKIVKRLSDSEYIDKLIVISRSEDIPKDIESVIEYRSDIGWDYKYRFTKEYRESEPLSRDLLMKIQPYLATAMAIAYRDTNFDIYSVLEARRLVYLTTRYWNYVIEKNRIDYMIFSYVPHTLHEYMTYVLGKIKGIPMTVFSSTHIPHIAVWGNSIETIGDNIKKTFDEGITGNIDNRYLASFLQNNRKKYNVSKRTKSQLKASRDEIKIELDRFIKPRAVINKIYDFLTNKSKNTADKEYIRAYSKKYCSDLLRSIKIYLHQRRIGYYDKHAVIPDYSKPYIYFGLQLTPEATTLPMAGVFDEQLLSIRILAKAAKACGVVVYVKDHYVQPRRDRYLYEELFKIDNVVCIRTDVPSIPLIENALAVSTQTGSCIIEGFIRGKHSLVFGDCYYWKGMPGLHVIDSCSQCKKIIKSIASGKEEVISKEIVDRYFYAMEKNTITYESYITCFPEEDRKQMDFDEIVKENCDLYINHIVKDMFS